MRAVSGLLLLALLAGASVTAQAQDAQQGSDAAAEKPASTPPPAEEKPVVVEKKAPPPKKKVVTVSVGTINVVVLSADGKKAASRSGKLGDKLFKADALGSGQSIEVSFTPLLGGEAGKPQQAMLMAASKAAPDVAAYAVARAKKDGSHTITLSTAAMDKQISNLGGELELTLLLGDPSAPKGVSGSLGSVVLPEAPSDAPPKPKLLSATQQPLNNFKPNIAHTFRPPAKRAPAVVSLAFTGLAFAPLGVLVIYLGLLGANLKGLPSGAATLWVLLFHGGIAALLALYLLFWLQLNLAQTAPLALGLGLFVAGTGYKALSSLSDARLAEAKAAAVGAKKTN